MAMMQHRKVLLIAVAGAATTAAGILFMTDSIPAPRLLYPVLAIAFLAAGAGIGSVRLADPPTSRRSGLLSAVAAFAAGMVLATIAFAVYTHFASLQVEDPRHRVAWPLFAVLFTATILLGVTAFSVATIVTSAIVGHRRSRRLRSDG